MFVENLKKLIKDRKVSKTNFAAYINTSRSTLDDYLNGTTFMPSDKIEKTAIYFNVTVGFLFGEDQSGQQIEQSLQKQLSEMNKQLSAQTKLLNKILSK
jgi:transcriptional regulator with XRE-family HTH domain